MLALYRIFVLLTLVFLCGGNLLQGLAGTNSLTGANRINTGDWDSYMQAFPEKHYGSLAALNAARLNYAYNSKLIALHNLRYDQGRVSYRLKENQFTDMRLASFNALFPKTTQLPGFSSNPGDLPMIPETFVAPNTYDPSLNLNFNPAIKDQGVRCNSGWAYATASSVEWFAALRTGVDPISRSAQQLIDCAGRGKGCICQVPQAAFEYLISLGIDLKQEEGVYENAPELWTPQMCLVGTAMPPGETITAYSNKIRDGDDVTLQKYVANEFPVVIEFNPTSFEFMHYAGGVFNQPATSKGSHYMVVIGYDAESWILQNSFGTTWGVGYGSETRGGYMHLKRNDIKAKLPKSAIFPTSL